jgi:hypothetical protein
MTQYSGKIIRKAPVVPSQTSASGVWTTADAAAAVKNNTWPVAGVPNPISRSVRLRSSASAYLNRTPSAVGSRTTWTYSCWVKRGKLGADQALISAYTGTATINTQCSFMADDTLDFYDNNGSYVFRLTTTQVFRDPAAWYHIVLVLDTTQATASNRVKIYVNGTQITSFSTATYPPLNDATSDWNSNTEQRIGRHSTNYFDGYFAEINNIDGQALTPSSFGTTDSLSGAWVPMPYTGTYGTNGFYLNFKDNTSTTTLGYDYSGNGNNWTANNISLTAGTTYDSMVDVPTLWMPYNTAGDVGATVRGNYCVLNRLVTTLGGSSPPTISDGNLNISFGNAGYSVGGNMFVSSGQIYFEVSGTNAGGITNTISFTGFISDSGSYWGYQIFNGDISSNLGASAYDGTAYGSGAWPVIGIAVDLSTGKIWWRNDSGWFGSGNPATGANPAFTNVSGNITPYWNGGGGGYSGSHYFNFGQRPFTYTPPSGFKTLNTFNLPAPTINNGASYMAATLYAGTSVAQSIVNTVNGVSFQPDFVWGKNRTNVNSHRLTDVNRGVGKVLFSDGTAGDTTGDGQLSSFNSNGFSLTGGAGAFEGLNQSGNNYVAWQWKAGGTAVSNTAGSITSSVSANTTAGFSIVTWTGGGSAGTIGHGLGVTPNMIIVKNRSGTQFWFVNHASISTTQNLYLNDTVAVQSDGIFTSRGATTFGVGTGVAGSATNYVAYCFAAVAGYSAFGSYTGNGSADGVFVYLGFRARFLMIKSTSTGGWVMLDTSRDPYNDVDNYLYANSSAANAGSSNVLDINSNGFKIRNSWTDINGSGTTYIYAAFAENPFKYSNAR